MTAARAPRRRGSARRAACRVLEGVLAEERPLDPLLERAAAGLGERDRALLRELVMGSLRWLARLDHVIASAASRPLRQIDPPLLAPLRIGAYQLLFLDRVPAYAAVSEAVSEARRRAGRRRAGFVNGVLRRVAERRDPAAWPVEAGDEVARLAIETSHPELLVRRWLELFGERRAREVLDASNRRRALHLLAFADRGGRDELAAALSAEGVETESAPLAPQGLVVRQGHPLRGAAFAAGAFYVQDQASQAAALIPPPRPGERILDLAAAPGGKSFSLLAREPRVRLVAADRSRSRLAVLRRNLRRLSRRLPLVCCDAALPPFAGAFDRVVLDIPCSGTGTLSQHPERRWRLDEAEIDRLGRQGLELVRGAAPLVAAGGLLVVITCSLEPEENERVAERFLALHPDFGWRALEDDLEGELAAGLFAPGRWRLPTGADHDGFTVLVMRRTMPLSGGGRAGPASAARRPGGRGRRSSS